MNSTLLTSKIIGGTKSSATYVVPVKVRAVHKGSASLLSDMHGITAIKVAEECSKDLDCAYVEVSEDQSFIEEIIYYNEDYDRTLKNPDDNFAIIKVSESILRKKFNKSEKFVHRYEAKKCYLN